MEYKRLTERRGNLVIDKCGNCENVSNPQGCTEHCCYEVMKNRLAELEDKIEQGTLIELPCKVGDTAYCVFETYNAGCMGWKIRDVKVYNIVINCNNDFITDIGEYTPCYMVYGTDIFSIREEAEKRLKELQK